MHHLTHVTQDFDPFSCSVLFRPSVQPEFELLRIYISTHHRPMSQAWRRENGLFDNSLKWGRVVVVVKEGRGRGGVPKVFVLFDIEREIRFFSRLCNPDFIKPTIWKGNMPKKEKTSALWSEFRTSPCLYFVWVLSKKTNITYQCGDIFLRYLKMFDFPQHYWIQVTNRLHIGHHEGDTPWICHYPLGWDQANTLQINGTKISRTELQS